MHKQDYYEVLGVGKTASVDEIKKAFRKRALLAHPDQGGDNKKFQKLKSAFEHALRQKLSENPLPTWQEITMSFGSYDPFVDPNYISYKFFEADNDAIADFERSILAQDCKHCHGLGIKTELVDPSKGFMGVEERFCICQRVK